MKQTKNFPLRVLTFNVWGLKIGPFHIARDIQARMDRIASALHRSESDVIVLQEVWCASIAKFLIRESGYPYHVYQPGRGTLRGPLGNGLLMLSRLPIVHTQALRFHHCTSPDEWFVGKGAVAADIHTAQGAVRVINTHLGSGKRPLHVTMRLQQLRQLQSWVAGLEHHLPSVIAGDFNFSPSSLEYCVFRHWAAHHFRESLADTFAVRHGQADGHTYFVDRSYHVKPKMHDRNERIDYVFLLTPKQSRLDLTVEESTRILNDAEHPYSDHCAVLSTVGIRIKPTLREIMVSDPMIPARKAIS